jgi:hypothetical protein
VSARIAVVLDARPKPWTSALVSAVRQLGVAVDVVAHPVEGVATLDLRSAEREASETRCVWRLSIGDERGGVPAFGEALSGAQSVDVALIAVSPEGARTLRFGRFPYASHHARTIARIVEMAAIWIAREVANPSRPGSVAALPAPPAGGAGIRIADRLRFAYAEARRFAGHALRYAFEEARWDVAVAHTSVERFISDPAAVWLQWFARNKREFLADPFLTQAGAKNTRVLCETLDEATTRIVAIDLDDRFGERHPVAVGSGPASYPHVIDVDGEVWLTPEQHRRGTLEAYALEGTQTRHVAVMLEGVAAVDPTIVRYEDRWWLFCTDRRGGGANYALHVFWAEHPRGPWHAHARNPVKIDIAGARPAGNCFFGDGALYRPAQDCSGRYGSAVTIQRVDVLTPDEFAERAVERIDVSALGRKGAVGVHTFSHGHGWVAVDAQFARWSLRKPLRLLQGRFA